MLNKTNAKILWMVPKWTLPAIDGARVATDSLIRTTIAAGAEIDVLCLSQISEKTDPQQMIDAWKAVRSVPGPATYAHYLFLSTLMKNSG